MILYGTAKNIEDFIKVDSKMSYRLHSAGFIPKYKDSCGIYYVKTTEILKFIGKEDYDGKQ